jgi:hypothetical protein
MSEGIQQPNEKEQALQQLRNREREVKAAFGTLKSKLLADENMDSDYRDEKLGEAKAKHHEELKTINRQVAQIRLEGITQFMQKGSKKSI